MSPRLTVTAIAKSLVNLIRGIASEIGVVFLILFICLILCIFWWAVF